MKRVVDAVVGMLLALLALPLILAMALVLAVELRDWPFFWQLRVGRGERLFAFVKLRTLPRSVPHDANKYEIGTVALGRFGSFIRRHHLDELPQLFLVVGGRMSLVGPRPEMPRLHETLDPMFAMERTSVLPGCTGLWQIGEGCTRLIGEAPDFDRVYLRNASLRLDLWIFIRTVRNLFPGRRLVQLDDIPTWARAPREELGFVEVAETADV